jgi:hypothetical protein
MFLLTASVEESERKESELNKVHKDTNLSLKKKRKRCRKYYFYLHKNNITYVSSNLILLFY